jgi:hypothetical protein
VVDSAIRQQLLVAIADLAGLSAYVARDLGAHADADEHYRLSLSAAFAGQDRALGAYAIVRMAGHHLELRQPRQVLDLVARARAGARDLLTSGDLANQYCLEAWAQAQLGDAEAVRRAVGNAEEAFTQASGGVEDRPWARQHVTEAELHSLVGAAFVDLARFDRDHAEAAISRLGRALELRGPLAARNRALDEVSVAEAYLRMGAFGDAAAAALRALDGMREIDSGRLTMRVDTLATSMARHVRDHRTVAAFTERYRAQRATH